MSSRLSKLRKKVKDKLSGAGNSKKGRGTSVGDEGFDHSPQSLQSEPAIAAVDEVREGIGAGVGGDDPQPDDSLPVSRSMAELECEPGGSDDYTARQERDQKGLHPHSYERAGRRSSEEGRGAGRKGAGQVDSPRSESDIGRTPTSSILQGSEPEST